MPQVGDIKTVKELGKPWKGPTTQYQKYIWVKCPHCQQERWKAKKPYETSITGLCVHCSRRRRGAQSSGWRSGKSLSTAGYMQVYLEATDFFYPMANKHGYVYEHRLVMAKHLGRCLHSWEKVHHKNSIKVDNRWENLGLVMSGAHSGRIKCPYCHKEFSIK